MNLYNETMNGKNTRPVRVSSAYLDRLIHKPKRQIIHQLIRILNPVRKLPNDPHHGRLALRLVQRVQVLTQHGDDALVLARVPPEDVLDHDHGFLDDVCHFRLNELEESFDAVVCGGLDFDG